MMSIFVFVRGGKQKGENGREFEEEMTGAVLKRER